MFEVDKKTKRVLRHPDGRPRAKTSHTLNPVPLHVALGPETSTPAKHANFANVGY